MTAVLGASLHTVERARGGQAVVQCRDVRVTRGLYLNGDHPKKISLRLDPDPHAPAARVSGRRADGREEKPLFEGVFQWGEHDEQPPAPGPARVPALRRAAPLLRRAAHLPRTGPGRAAQGLGRG
ncbi:hypothetical protein GCM10020000_73590 [Streptomyces olivoverticillatus]